MKRNKSYYLNIFAIPYLASQSIDEIDKDSSAFCAPLVGGQAVMDGVMMRNGDCYGLAVRRQDKTIVACRRPWISILNLAPLRIPFLRGFPVLLETLYNGIGALNYSAIISEDESANQLSKWQLLLSLIIAIALAVVLFVFAPHLLSVIMYLLHVGDDVEGLSFHLWDGFFKVLIFLGYIYCISRLPEIKAVFAYHGAEHKTIHAFEEAEEVSAFTAQKMSRLHPRCGTTFLLFVITMSIILHTLLVPVILHYINPGAESAKHLITLGIKFLLIIPISALSYELIRQSARLRPGLHATLLQAPGLILQKFTTSEPSIDQLEVAVISLYTALDIEDRQKIKVVPFSTLDSD